MNASYLRRIDPQKNMARFYKMDVQPDLFGEWTLIREWGRIGRSGQVRLDPYPTDLAAKAALEQLQGKKVRKGYSS